MTKQSHRSIRYRFNEPLRLVHSDVMGMINPADGIDGNKFIVTFTDDYSRYTMTYPIPDKISIAKAFKDFLSASRCILGNSEVRVNHLRIDGGREYLTTEMKELCENENIWMEVAPPDTPALNGTAERVNYTLAVVRASLIDSGMPLEIWSPALAHAVYVHNRLPHKSVGMKAPYELFYKRPVDISFVKRFGCIGYRRIPHAKTATGKFAPKGQKCIILGNKPNTYILMWPETMRITTGSDVEVTESRVFKDDYPTNFFKQEGFPKFESDPELNDLNFSSPICITSVPTLNNSSSEGVMSVPNRHDLVKPQNLLRPSTQENVSNTENQMAKCSERQ